MWYEGNTDQDVITLAYCHSQSSYDSLSSNTRYICTLHWLHIGHRYSSVGWFEGNHERRIPMAKQRNRWVVSRHQGMCWSSAGKVGVIVIPCLSGFKHVQVRETHLTGWPNLWKCLYYNAVRAQHISTCWEWSASLGMQLEGVQDGVIEYVSVTSYLSWTSFGIKIWPNVKGSSLALLTTDVQSSVAGRTWRKLVPGLSSLVCKLKIHSANLSDIFNLYTIMSRFLTLHQFQKPAKAYASIWPRRKEW